MMCRYLVVLLALWCGPVAAQSAKPVVTAKLTPDSVAIGDQFRLRVEVSKDLVQQVEFPLFNNNMLGDKIEILNEGDVDTIEIKGRNVKLVKEYLLTIFDEGIYSLGRFPTLYADKNIVDTLYSKDSLFLTVSTFEIDTLTQTIYDIKPVMNTPFRFGEISGYLLWALLALVLIAAAIYFYRKYRKSLPVFGKPKVVEPAHVIAIRELEAVHNQKLWQNNKHKIYYTKITDVLREYIEARYGICAMEMTTEEIVAAVKSMKIPVVDRENMVSLLKTSDYVKFAKYIPEAIENENSYTSAFYFVENTKVVVVDSDAEQKQESQKL